MKKFLGLSNTVMGSAGMIGKSSGDGKWVRPKVCQRTMSVLSIELLGPEVASASSIQAGRPCEGSPEVWGT